LELEEARLLHKIELTRRQANKMQGVKDDEDEFNRLRNQIEHECQQSMTAFKGKKYLQKATRQRLLQTQTKTKAKALSMLNQQAKQESEEGHKYKLEWLQKDLQKK